MKTSTTKARTISRDATVAEAARLMERDHVGFLVCVGADGEPVGALTDRDLVLRVVAAGDDPETCRVTKVMSTPLVTLDHGESVFRASAVMRRHGMRKLPLVDQNGRVRGLLTADDVIAALARRLFDLDETIRREQRNEQRRDESLPVFGRE